MKKEIVFEFGFGIFQKLYKSFLDNCSIALFLPKYTSLRTSLKIVWKKLKIKDRIRDESTPFFFNAL